MEIKRPERKQPLPPEAKRVFKGILFDVYQWEQKLYDGTTTTFEQLRRPDTVVIIPALTDRRLLLEEEDQPGTTSILSFPAGRLDAGEDPETAAKRELLEETGYEPATLILWKALQPDTLIDRAIYIFIARDCKKVAEPNLDAGEQIKTHFVTLDDVIALMDEPKFVNMNIGIELIKSRYDKEERTKLEQLLFGG